MTRYLLPCVLGCCVAAVAQSDQHADEPKQSSFPIRRVLLYKNGVGYFEHAGKVTGTQRVTVDFTSAQLNDVLQSLTVLDLGGGHISGADYNSTAPLEQQLAALSLNLGNDPGTEELYDSLRGARLTIRSGGGSFTGRLMTAEQESLPTPKDAQDALVPSVWALTLVSDAGVVRTLRLLPGADVQLLDPGLHRDLNRYLQLVADARTLGVRHLTLEDEGTGTRELRVSYISEVPIWKSTYRILFDTQHDGKPLLQGWAVVDNTVGEDWNNVQLSLIAGAPQSFIQPISQPYYSRRPEIALPQEAELTPQTHESGTPPAPPPPLPSAVARVGRGAAGGVAGGVLGKTQTVTVTEAAPLLRTGEPEVSTTFTEESNRSISAATSTAAFDDYFVYSLTSPVTIRKNESALVPILQTRVQAERVSLWSPQATVPLRAVWLTNTSDFTLDRGSFSIVDNGAFGGQGLTDPIHPKEKRLLSYAADQAVHVSTVTTQNDRRVQHLSISKGVLVVRQAEIKAYLYQVHNAATDARQVVIEDPVEQGWSLTSETKPVETTDTVARYEVQVAPGATYDLKISKRRIDFQNYALLSTSSSQIQFLLQTNSNSPTLASALQPVLEARAHLANLDEQIKQRQAEVDRIGKDQERLRANIAALKGTPEEKDLTRRYVEELNQQEDRLNALRKEIDDLRAQRSAAEAALNSRIESLSLDEEES